TRYRLTEPMLGTLIPAMCRTGRCLIRRKPDDTELPELRWDDGPPWEFWLEVKPEGSGKKYQVAGVLRRGEERRPLSAPVMLIHGGLVFWDDQVARLEDFGAF